MNHILKFVAGLVRGLCLFVFTVGTFYTAIVIFTSGYEYRLVGEQVKRAWHVKLPGYESYLDINSKPPVYRERFTMRKQYRISEWIDPEWPQELPDNGDHLERGL